ncbi:MAG TPA: hypothetical protein PKC21_10210 [Oligoflexia bacterium]|nr:hypothetical protein [Oligoflexia bacterium]HMR25713.1 hypothetical protein [Oligoflexia bacterium]
MTKRPVQHLTLILISLLFTACGANSTLDSNNESVNLGLSAFETYRSADESLKCNDLANNYSDVGFGWYAARRGIGDELPSLKGIGDELPSRFAAKRGIGDELPSFKGIGDELPSRFMYDSSVMMIEESGNVKYQEEMTCANFVVDMQVEVASGADSVFVIVGDKTVSVNVEEGVAKINVALEDLKSTEIQVQDSISGDILGVVFQGQ